MFKALSNLFGSLLTQGPTVPILVVVNNNSANPFRIYIEEILKAEGFNEFETKNLSSVYASTLKNYKIVILTQTGLTSNKANIFNNYVANGGKLIAFKPDKKLAPVFGIEYSDSSISNGYILVDTNTDIGKGIVDETIQFHGVADICTITDPNAEMIAELYRDENTSGSSPAIVYNQYNNGASVAFLYDLNKSIIYSRQGNLNWAGKERDGITGIRALDMFVSSNGNNNWINSSKISIPQADEQMRLLSHVIESLSAGSFPLPRLWYFPYSKKSLLIFTGDADDSPVQTIDNEIKDVQASGGNMSIYLIGTYIDPLTVNTWINDGNEVSIHYDDTSEAQSPTLDNMYKVYDEMTNNFISKYGYSPHTVRNHWITWYGWADQAEIESGHNHHFDCNYYHYDHSSLYGNFLGGPGFFTGSGLPMKFISSDGRVLDIYQSTTQLPDEEWGDSIYDTFITLLDRSLYEGKYIFINANFHPILWNNFRDNAIKVMEFSRLHGIPIWTAQKTLEFLQMRDSAAFSNISWANNTLSFQLNSPVKGEGLTFMLPFKFNGLYLSGISKDGVEQSYTIRNINGTDYALVVTNSESTFSIGAQYTASKPDPVPESMFEGWLGNSAHASPPQAYELGTIFEATVPGRITGIKVYGVTGESGQHVVRIWDNSTNKVIAGPYTLAFTGNDDWVTFNLPEPIAIKENLQYTVSVSTGSDAGKYYTYIYDAFTHEGNNSSHLKWPENAGVYSTQLGSRPTSISGSSNYLRDIIFIPG